MEDFKKDMNSNTLILGDLKTPLSKMDRSSKQNIDKDSASLNSVLDQMVLTDIYRPFIPKKQNTHFSNSHGTFSEIDHTIHTNQASTISRKFKLYQAFSHNTRA